MIRRRGHVACGMVVYSGLLLLLHVFLPTADAESQKNGDYYTVSKLEQDSMRAKHRKDCIDQMIAELDTTPDGHCRRTWDTLMCWPPTPNNTQATQPCPHYINLFRIHGNATRTCTENATWWRPPGAMNMNLTGWTNFTQCKITSARPRRVDPLIQDHMSRIRLMYNIGYGVSLVSLIAASITMAYFKMLNCPRNILHINLFLSFLLRAMVSLLKENLLVNGLGLPNDVKADGSGGYFFLGDSGTHWECKLLFTAFNYLIACNYLWIFVEGLYLHTLIFVAVFSENSSITWYIVFGWVSPLSFIIPWVIVRALLDDVYCWNVNGQMAFFWIINGPLTCTVILNFVFFLNIVRVLFTKLNTSHTHETRKYRYRKLAKSTLVLIPLFGVHYIVFVCLPYGVISDISPHVELVKIYFEMLFNSIEGFFVALLFCFLNGEVQAEIRKRYHRYHLRRGSFGGRNSYWHSTSTSAVPKPQAQTNPRDIEEKISLESPEPVGNGNVSNGLRKNVSWTKSIEDQNEAQICLVLSKHDLGENVRDAPSATDDETEETDVGVDLGKEDEVTTAAAAVAAAEEEGLMVADSESPM